jgi:hypothetical protein
MSRAMRTDGPFMGDSVASCNDLRHHVHHGGVHQSGFSRPIVRIALPREQTLTVLLYDLCPSVTYDSYP